MKVNGITAKWYYSKVDAVIDNTLTSDVVKCVIVRSQQAVCVGTALCSPNDAYDKEFGRKLSLTRAVEISGFSKELKTAIWEAYRNMTKVPRW